MKVKCIRLLNEITGQEEKSSSSITLNKIYDVLWVSIDKKRNITQIQIINDSGEIPILKNLISFKIVDSRIPRNWEVFYDEDNLLELSPRAWMEDGFWERYFDYDKKAVEIFEREKEIILNS